MFAISVLLFQFYLRSHMNNTFVPTDVEFLEYCESEEIYGQDSDGSMYALCLLEGKFIRSLSSHDGIRVYFQEFMLCRFYRF